MYLFSKYILSTNCIPNTNGAEEGRVPGVRQGVKSSGKEAGAVPPPCWGVSSLDPKPALQVRSRSWALRRAPLHPWPGTWRHCPNTLLDRFHLKSTSENLCFTNVLTSVISIYCFLQCCLKHLAGFCCPSPWSCLWITGKTSEQGPERFRDLFQVGQWVRMPEHCSQLNTSFPRDGLTPPGAENDLRCLAWVRALIFWIRKVRAGVSYWLSTATESQTPRAGRHLGPFVI